jgi:acyl-CoA thioesterase-1
MPLRSGSTVLFMGDSITHAHRRPDEIHDCYQLGCGYVNSIAAELAAADADAGWRFVNRGECGDTVARLADRWDTDCLAADPAVVSILIGINDARAVDGRPADFRDGYARLLDRTRRRLPDAPVVLLEPFGLAVDRRSDNEVIGGAQLERLAVLQRVVRDVATAAGATFVPLQHLFDPPPATAWALDGIHPTAAGHWRIARAWVAAARAAGWFPNPKDDR